MFWHPDIEHEKVGLELQQRRHDVLAMGAAAHDFQVVFQTKQLLETFQNDRVVVGQQDANPHDQPSTGDSGRVMSSLAPDSLEEMTRPPPSAETRSFNVTGPAFIC